MSASQDGSESVDQFLARIASVKEGRDQANEERNRRKEEDFLRNRKERQARRLERARSLSPSKTGPSSTGGSSLQNTNVSRDSALNPPIDFSPRAGTLSRSNAVSSRTSPTLEPQVADPKSTNVAAVKPLQLNSGAGLSRSGTLSWQQRPARDGAVSRPRPLSSIETVRQIPKATDQDDGEETRPEPTRQDIAAALSAKDPTWFRQTQERGHGSAAFRKNQVEDVSVVEHATRSQMLPGLSRQDLPTAPMSIPIQDTHRAQSAERETGQVVENLTQRATSPAIGASPHAPKLDLSLSQSNRTEMRPTTEVDANNRPNIMLSARSPSPTKGLGGFVESAMMKRSDSVSKRWSVRANAGLKRGDSIANSRPLSGMRTMPPASLSKNIVRDGSPASPVTTSRPSSKQGDRQGLSQSATPEKMTQTIENKSQPPPAETSARPETPSPESELNRSPSKTMDSRRWSPTKSSWLESALLSTPDPPKLQPSREEVPAWKLALQRNKASRDLSPDKSKSDVQQAREVHDSEPVKPTQPLVISEKLDAKLAAPSESRNSTLAATRPEPEVVRPSETRQVLSSPDPGSDSFDVNEPGVAVTPASDAPLTGPDNSTTGESDVTSTEVKVEKNPPALKPKPQSPQAHDFRSSLRSRGPTSGDSNAREPEFKSVFGKLKRTQTQNYVAPDVLKNNILSGKAALNVTGGPQKTQRVDEFKESILQKKEAMKASAVQKKENPALDSKPIKPEPTVPEALARRKTLSRATPPMIKSQNAVPTPAQAAQEQLKSVTKPTVGPKPIVTSPQASSQTLPLTRSPEPLVNAKVMSSQIEKSPSATTLPQTKAPVKEPVTAATLPIATVQTKPVSGPQKSATLPKAELPAGSKLASRLNPNLASLLSRGNSPRPVPTGATESEQNEGTVPRSTTIQPSVEDPSIGGELTHMTKGRAKGPKRRAPKSEPTQKSPSGQSRSVNDTTSATVVEKPLSRLTVKSSTVLPRTTSRSRSPARSPVIRIDRTSPSRKEQTATPDKVKPTVASKSPELRKVSSPLSTSQTDGTTPKRVDSGRFDIAADKNGPIKDGPVSSDRHTAAPEKPQTPKPDSNILPLTPSKSRINSSKPFQSVAGQPTKPQSPKPVTGLGLVGKSSFQFESVPTTPQPKPTIERVVKPQPPNKRSGSDEVESSKKMLSTHLSTPIEGQRPMEFDASALLSVPRDSGDRTKVVSRTIWEIGGGGKKTPMPPQQEHILFEESMYLLVHTFSDEAGTKASDVQLWCGDSVSDAAIEDVQLFCKRDAREYNTKLEVIRQGKESARFFQALGGILIVRRSKASSMYMLCGRRHLGHIAFDEVDVAASNLCSGFAYLISAKFGKLYLWKGKGSGADEVGCARLIGMDLGLTGEIEEVSEGQESSSFWESFPQSSRNTDLSGEWQQRANHECYPTSLYRIEVDTPKATGGFWGLRAASPPKSSNKANIETISPFSCRDLEPTNVYVLDTYRSIFVHLGSQAGGKVVEFVTAVHLAQELAMLSPSIQDRSLLPTCMVTFGEPPPDFRMCFRKWPVGKFSGASQSSACLKLEHVLQAMTL